MTESSQFESALADLYDQSPEKAHMVDQYRTVAGKFVQFWDEVYLRTETGDWREDGVGSCHSNPGEFVTFVDGEMTEELGTLWEALDADNPKLSVVDSDSSSDSAKACRFHRFGKGCILGDVKTPRCFTHTDQWQWHEITERFGIEFPDFRTPLVEIQQGGVDLTNGDCSLHPEKNDELVERTVEETDRLIEHIKTFPILSIESSDKAA